MRIVNPLDALFPRTRKDILVALFMNPEHSWSLSDLADHLSLTPSSLQRELARLTESGILTLTRDGRRTFYRPNPDSPITEDLNSLCQKTAGIVPTLNGELAKTSGRSKNQRA